jgi:hypothetical protein
VPIELIQPKAVAVTLYTPEAAKVTPANVGFCVADENELGPVQLYVAPAIVEQVKLKVWPTHNGELALTVGVGGNALTTILTVPAGPVHPKTVAKAE